MKQPDCRRAVLYAALEFVQLAAPLEFPEFEVLRRWLGTWAGICRLAIRKEERRMATKAAIAAAINVKVGTAGYNIWRIGLTHDPDERKRYWTETEKQITIYWSQWTADSLADAQEIEAYFINKGMKGGTGGDLSARRAVYVYIF